MMGLSGSFTEALGLTLLDSLWQGAIILLVCTLLLALLRSGAARWRYRLVLVGLLAMPVLGIITFSHHYEPAATFSEGPKVMPSTTEAQIGPFQLEVMSEVPGMIERWQMWAQQNAHWVVTAWAIGLLIFALRMAGGFFMISSLKTSAEPLSQSHWQERLGELGASLGIKLRVQIKESARVSSPIVVGYLKPLIIFPLGLIQGISTDQVEAILLHELAHIKRQDYLVNLLVSLLQAIYFYHPAYWWLQQQLDAEREYSCDDLVIGHVNQLSLVKALTAVKEFQMNRYTPALGFAGHKNQLLKRVERIMKKKTRTNWLGSLLSMSALLLSFFLMSYQSATPIEEEEPNRIITTAVPFLLIEPVDSITVQQAVMQLLEPKENNIILELDGRGRLIDMMRNGEPIGQAELKIFQHAHAKLRDYNYAKDKLSEEELAQERELLKEELQKLEERWSREKETLTEIIIEERKRKLEKEALSLNQQLSKQEVEQKLVEYERLLIELKLSQSEIEEQRTKASTNLDELLKHYPSLIREYKEGNYSKWMDQDSLMFTMYPSTESKGNVYAKYKIAIAQLKQRLAYLESNNLPLIEEKYTLEKYKEEMQALERKLQEQSPLVPTKFDFTTSDYAQRMAARQLNARSTSKDVILIVVDGEVKENWTLTDLDKLNQSLAFKSVEVIRAESVTDPKFKKWMESRDALVQVTTQPGEKGFERPSVRHAPPPYEQLPEAEVKERFTKQMLERIEADKLAPEGWNTLELSQKALLIDGKKQSKKTLKKYLKLYENLTGKALSKGKIIELQN